MKLEHSYLGIEKVPALLSDLEIDHFFTLSPHELDAARARRGALNQLGLSLHIGFVRMTGRRTQAAPMVSAAVQAHVCEQLDQTALQLASLRALYRRRSTLYEHQRLAAEILGFRDLATGREPHLIAHIRREAISVFEISELVLRARLWLYDRKYFWPPERRLRAIARAALRLRERALAAKIRKAVDTSIRSRWIPCLQEVMADGNRERRGRAR